MTTSGPGLDPQHEQGRRNSLAAALVCLVTVVAFETMSVATIMPDVTADIGGLGLYGWAFSGLALGQVLGIVVAGAWTDRATPVRPILAGLAVYTLGLVVSGTADSMFVVVVGRVLQGYGAGTVPAVAYVCVGRAFTEGQRARVFAWMATAWVVPSLVGPGVAGVVSEQFGWRVVFLGLIPVVVGVGALAIRPIAALGPPDASTDEPQRGAAHTIGLALVAVVGTGLALGGLQSTTLPILAVCVVSGGAALLWAFARITPPGTMRVAPGLPAAVAVRGMLTFSFLGADAFVSLALTGVRDTSTQFAGIVLSSAAFVWTAGSWTAARTIERVGPRRLVRWGLVFVTVGIAAFVGVVVTEVSPWLAIVAWAIGGYGIGLAYSPLSQAALSAAAPGQLGAATSGLQLSDVLGFALGSGLGGALVAFTDQHEVTVDGSSVLAGVILVFGITAAVAVAGGIAARRMHRFLPGAADRSDAPADAQA